MNRACYMVFSNLPAAACWQFTGLWRHEQDGYMLGGPDDPEAGSCPRMANLPAAAVFAYTSRACSPYSACGPAGGPEAAGGSCCACGRLACARTWDGYYDWFEVGEVLAPAWRGDINAPQSASAKRGRGRQRRKARRRGVLF